MELTPRAARAIRVMAWSYVVTRPVGRMIDARDLVQEGMLGVLKVMRREGATALPDARAILAARDAMKAALDEILRQSAGVAAAIDARYARDKPPAITPDEALDVRLAVAALPADQARAVELVDVRGLSRSEAAAEMGVTPRRVRSLRYAAAEALAAALRPSYAEEFARHVAIRRPERWHLQARRIGPRRRDRSAEKPRLRDTTAERRRRKVEQIAAHALAVKAGLYVQPGASIRR
jgi:RNA polymerase sigma factor (sigma-70 family)